MTPIINRPKSGIKNKFNDSILSSIDNDAINQTMVERKLDQDLISKSCQDGRNLLRRVEQEF
jgi:hypothetical protein